MSAVVTLTPVLACAIILQGLSLGLIILAATVQNSEVTEVAAGVVAAARYYCRVHDDRCRYLRRSCAVVVFSGVCGSVRNLPARSVSPRVNSTSPRPDQFR